MPSYSMIYEAVYKGISNLMYETNKFNHLRKRAEAYVNQPDLADITIRDPKKILEILHELEVHQVELELQNHDLIETQDTLNQTFKEYESLFEFAPVGYIVANQKGIIKKANLKLTELLEIPRSELIKSSFTRFVFADDKDKYYLHRRDIFRESVGKSTIEVKLQRANNTTFDARLISLRMAEESTFRTAIVDITPLKEAERRSKEALDKLEELNTLRKRLIDALMHEFRTPLSIITMSVEMIERYGEKLDEDDRIKRFKNIYSNVEYLTTIVERVLTANDDSILVKSNVQQEVTLKDILQEFANQWESDSQQVKLELDFHNDAMVSRWDSHILRRILYELISNAMTYSFKDVVLRATTSENEAIFQVIDEGTGILDEDLPHIYEMFYRGVKVRNNRGMGVGLHTVKETVNALNGTINVETIVGKGTTFTVILPC